MSTTHMYHRVAAFVSDRSSFATKLLFIHFNDLEKQIYSTIEFQFFTKQNLN